MSTKFKLKVSNVKTTRKANSRARISSESQCKEEHKSCGQNKSCGRREDPAVEAMQEAGKDISDIFKQLKDERTAAKIVKAIRCRDARTIQCLLDCHCRVVSFFHMQNKDCVRICCSFGKNHDVTVTFDICVKREQDECRRQTW